MPVDNSLVTFPRKLNQTGYKFVLNVFARHVSIPTERQQQAVENNMSYLAGRTTSGYKLQRNNHNKRQIESTSDFDSKKKISGARTK
jgi:hypothetical protein